MILQMNGMPAENLSLPLIGTDWNSFSDENYEYLWEGEDLYIYENGTGNCLYVLHYPTDKWYVNGNNAYLKDGLFMGRVWPTVMHSRIPALCLPMI